MPNMARWLPIQQFVLCIFFTHNKMHLANGAPRAQWELYWNMRSICFRLKAEVVRFVRDIFQWWWQVFQTLFAACQSSFYFLFFRVWVLSANKSLFFFFIVEWCVVCVALLKSLFDFVFLVHLCWKSHSWLFNAIYLSWIIQSSLNQMNNQLCTKCVREMAFGSGNSSANANGIWIISNILAFPPFEFFHWLSNDASTKMSNGKVWTGGLPSAAWKH